jgi:hypothetical protein
MYVSVTMLPQVRDTGLRRAGASGTNVRAGMVAIHDALQGRHGTATEMSAIRHGRAQGHFGER